MPSLLPWLPLVACFLQDHVFLSSGSPLLPQFDQARILLSSWLPDCRCFTFMFRSMYSCRHCFHSCRWFKITGINGCGSPTRKGTAALWVVPCSARFRKFTIRSVCWHRYHLCFHLVRVSVGLSSSFSGSGGGGSRFLQPPGHPSAAWPPFHPRCPICAGSWSATAGAPSSSTPCR